MIVVDASVIAESLLRTEGAAAVDERLFTRKEEIHAPFLLDVEIAQVLRRFAAAGIIDDSRGREALSIYTSMRIVRHEQATLLRRIWSLRHVLSAYDAAYVALAEVLGVPLLTRDKGTASAGGHFARVQLI